ncbi:uncharacterized protein LOC103952430 [Pyrus x bretschneideri]|uniref:uncharacterized protein LOC103952430 n=1 Tax=Pyrus x bretschneideri TaxID=225117 RepID=UPI00202ED527|nr:uncharacterized protein LOC103952430 [Pyrus x bretschneideri]
MNQQSQGTGSLSSPDPPMKRKRGRPRKDENLAPAESPTVMPGADGLKKTKQSASTSDDVENEMVGQVVTGVIEGAFDAGYLLNVRVGDTDTQLRGVVFLQEKITPITPANDIAPHIRMCKRREIPLPPLNPQSQRYESARPSDQSNRQPVDVKPQIPTVPNQTQSSVPQSGIPESLENKSFLFVIPPVVNLPKNDAGLPLGRKVMSQQFPEPGTDSQSTPAMPKPEHNNVVEQEKVLEEVEAATVMEGPNGVEANKASKTETRAEPVADIPGVEPVCKPPEIQTQAVGSEKSTSFADEVKSFGLELNQTPVFAEPSAMTVMPVGELNQTPASAEPGAISVMPVVETEVKDHQIQAEAVDSENEKSALGHDGAKSPNLELNQTSIFAEPASVAVITGIETLCKDSQIQPPEFGPENSSLVHDAVKSLDFELNQTPSAAPVSMPSVSNIAAEGSIPLGTAELQIPTSDGISSVECDVEDVIPPAQS